MSRRSYNSAQSDRMEDVSYLSYSDERGDRGRQQRHQPGANFFDPHPDPVAASAPTSVRANSFSALDSSAKTTPRVSAASFPGSSGILKPKHFETPLTCWFWSQGHCNKSHGECLYAHYDTGIVAEQPVRFGSASGGQFSPISPRVLLFSLGSLRRLFPAEFFLGKSAYPDH